MSNINNSKKIQWKKSSFCGASISCVEIAKIGKKFAIRDSKNIEAGALLFTKDEWKAFIMSVKKGEFE